MKCPFCGTEFDVETLRDYDKNLGEDAKDDIKWETNNHASWQEGEQEELNVYQCQSCGGEIIADATTAATECPYCGNPVVMMGQLSGSLRPDIVIPFKLDKKQAKEILHNHYKGKPLLPKVFKDQNRIEEIKGIYVPFWLFDADANARIRYKATRVNTWSDSNYFYTRTKYYSVVRAGNLGFCNIPVDGSQKMEDELMESIEPYNISEAVDFQTAYLAGYFADKYDVDAESCVTRANARIRESTEEAFRRTVVGYTTVITEAANVNVQSGKASYALLPVWILNTEWNGEKYRFAVNGQTGKIAGNLPMDKGAFARWFSGVTAGAAAIAFAIMWIASML